MTMFKRAAIIGLGLIGSSICHSLRRGQLADEIVGNARSRETRETALRIGLVSDVFEAPEDAVAGADLVFVCIPVGASGAIAQRIGPALMPGAIVTDVGSVKASVIDAMAPHLPDTVHFVPGHPIAGTEYSGPESGFAELFENRWCILTPPTGTDPAAVQKLQQLWQAMGALVEVMEPDHHDLVLAITSHVPHLIAFNIVNTAAHLGRVTNTEVIQFSAGGFRDFTRIAASDPTMWRDVFLGNKEAVLEMLGRFSEDLSHLQRAVRYGDGDTLHKMFAEAREIRQQIIQAGQDTSQPDFGRRGESAAGDDETV